MFLDLPCSSYLVVTLLTLVVGSFSIMIHVLFKIIARALCLVLALDALMVYGSLTGFVFPPLPPLPVSQPLLLHLPALFSSGIIVLAIYVVLVSHLWFSAVYWGLCPVTLRWTVWVVGLVSRFSYLILTVSQCPSALLISFTLMFGVRLPSLQKGVIATILSL